METNVTEIAPDIFQVSTFIADVNLRFNQYVLRDDEPLLFHTGMRGLFATVSEAVEGIVPIDRVRWITFGHLEADESGSMNAWLARAPRSQVAHGVRGCLLSLNDLADRPPRQLVDDEVIELGTKRVRHLDTPHVLHGFDARLLYEETTATLLCGDLFTQYGDGPSLVDDVDLVGPAMAAEAAFPGLTTHAPSTGSTIRRLSALAPAALALMHGPAWRGDAASQLLALAEAYEQY